MEEVKDSSVHLVVTSPPYWKLKDYGEDQGIGQTSTTYDEYFTSICEVLRECVKKLVPDGKLIINIMPILLTGKNTKFSTYPYEWVIVFSKSGKRPPVDPAIKDSSAISHSEFTNWVQNSIWDFQPASAKQENHPAPFPEELPRRCIRLYSFVGDTVLDPFAGSGTTLKVARELGRNSIGYEINQEYESVIREKVGFASKSDEDTFKLIRG
jgi:site-specific DNA-methyltransferase (adenine-specific)